MFSFAKQYQKISIFPSQKGLEFPGGGGGGGGGSLRPKNLKKCVKFYWNFQRGGGEGHRKTSFCGGGMDIFWSYTFVSSYGSLISEECYNLNWMVTQTAI